eukprot:1149854-Pelagomonas_calceolata.AAC.1
MNLLRPRDSGLMSTGHLNSSNSMPCFYVPRSQKVIAKTLMFHACGVSDGTQAQRGRVLSKEFRMPKKTSKHSYRMHEL